MVKRFNDEEPIADKAYDVFGKNGDYIGYCNYYDGKWYNDDEDNNYKTEGTYYSDNHNDWLLMLEGLISLQEKK